jgi:hypothetical protein
MPISYNFNDPLSIKMERNKKDNKMKDLIVTLSFGVCLMINTMYQNAHAGLILDETPEIYEWTTINGVDWLSWGITSGLTIDEALDANLRWRMATIAELDQLFFNMLGDLNYSDDRVSINYHPSSIETDLAWGFVSEFEVSGSASYGAYAMTSIGRYGVSVGSSTSRILTYETGCDVSSCGSLAPYSSIGYAMVRATQVAEPSTLFIFALGIIGLAPRKFKKQS